MESTGQSGPWYQCNMAQMMSDQTFPEYYTSQVHQDLNNYSDGSSSEGDYFQPYDTTMCYNNQQYSVMQNVTPDRMYDQVSEPTYPRETSPGSNYSYTGYDDENSNSSGKYLGGSVSRGSPI